MAVSSTEPSASPVVAIEHYAADDRDALLGRKRFAVTARCRERGDQPRDVPVVERDDRLGIAPQAA